MKLRSLEIQGFKSFADRTRLEFNSGFTVVVGPNGSGKSNIADAVRWVFGEQSTKTLRGGKMEDVIFSGTQTRKSVGYAMVQLTIDNTDRTLAVEEDTVSISRRLYRSGDSEYRINSTAVRLKDIYELFMDTGLGRDGYSIIGQGRIAEIVSAKSRERREIFEEAAGISKYRYRKNEAEKKLEQAQDNLVRLRDILQELENRVIPLKEQSDKAREFLLYSEEKKSLEISLWMVALDELREKLSGHEDKLVLTRGQYEGMEEQIEEIEAAIGAIYTDMQHQSMEIDRVRGEIRAHEEESAKSDSGAAVFRNDIFHNDQQAERISRELAQSETGAGEVNRRIQEKQQELVKQENGLRDMEERLLKADDAVDEDRRLQVLLEEERGGLEKEHSASNSRLSNLELLRAGRQATIRETEGRIENLRLDSENKADILRQLDGEIAECAGLLGEIGEKTESLHNARGGYLLKRQSRSGKLEELRRRDDGLEKEIGARKQRVRVLEDMERNMEGFSGSVRYILGQAESRAIGGVYGTVASLITTQPAYATAIETALGGAMQNIVVDNESVAKQAIQMLAQAKAGRATFLPLTSIKSRSVPEHELARYDGYVGVGNRLVEVDPKFSEIAGNLLGRVVVMQDLDSGIAMSKATGYKYRVVTLDGQVINAGGSFTGGSSAKGSGILSRRGEIKRIGEDIEKLLGQREALSGDLKRVSEEVALIEASVEGIDAELKTAAEDKLRYELELKNLRQNRQDLTNAGEEAARQIKELEQKLESMRGEEDQYLLEAGQLRQELAERGQKMEDLAARITQIARRIQDGTDAAAAGRMELHTARTSREALAMEIRQMEEQASNAAVRKQKLESEREELLHKNQEIENQIIQLSNVKEELRARIQKANDDIARLNSRREELERETTVQRGRVKDLTGQKEVLSRDLARLEERQTVLQNEYNGVIGRLWDEYELTRSQAAALAVPLEDKNASQKRLDQLKAKIRAMGSVNLAAIEEYAEVNERYTFLRGQIEDVEESRRQLLELIDRLTSEMRRMFSDSFERISEEFTRIFSELFGGGRGELLLTGEEDVLESGVEIAVQPPGKLIKSLSLLSGGEQAFVAIAIYFAILKVRPAPFCILDEIEAALDDVNVNKFADYLGNLIGETQFIVITHRRGTMEAAQVLYGVTMQDEGVSRLLELNVGEVEEKLGIK